MNDRDIEDTRQAPEEMETKYCDECFEEMEWMPDNITIGFSCLPSTEGYWRCSNDFCPTKFEGCPPIEQEMAYELVDIKQKYYRLKKLEAYFKQVTEKHKGVDWSKVSETVQPDELKLYNEDNWIE